MTSERPYAARIAARLLLRKLWDRRGEFFPALVRTDAFLRGAPELLARNILGLALEYRDLSALSTSVRIAGFVDRETRQIVISNQFKRQWQRFTLAHEIGHWMLHPGETHFRERPMTAQIFSETHRPQVEVEADIFAAELLMPQKVVREHFTACFGEIIDSEVLNTEIARSLSTGLSIQISAAEVQAKSPLQLATLIARTPNYRGRGFKPLIEQFDVSPSAMGIQLLEAGLVR